MFLMTGSHSSDLALAITLSSNYYNNHQPRGAHNLCTQQIGISDPFPVQHTLWITALHECMI